MDTEFELAHEMYMNGDYKQAFEASLRITKSQTASNAEKSDAYNLMGILAPFDSNDEASDLSGIHFYIKALDLNPENVDALWNIIHEFGESATMHKNSDMLFEAIEKIEKIDQSITEKEKWTIDQKKKLAAIITKKK